MEILKERIPTPVLKRVNEFILNIPEAELDWPVHRWNPEILKLLSYIPARYGELCDPQIVVQKQGTEPYFLEFHIDKEPEWAEGRKYANIVGVSVSRQSYENGGLSFLTAGGMECPTLWEGSIFSFEPWEYHSPGVNQGLSPRVAIYFRWLNLLAPISEDNYIAMLKRR